jgi:hypothetical protein
MKFFDCKVNQSDSDFKDEKTPLVPRPKSNIDRWKEIIEKTKSDAQIDEKNCYCRLS